MTPISRRSWTRNTVARISFVSWSSTNIFQRGGPEVAGILNVKGDFEDVGELGSRGILRLSIESKALVCACCTVTGAVACTEESQATVTSTRNSAHLFERMARHD